MSDVIRVGLIRCDTHGMWYGAQMDEHDPQVLRQPMPVEDEMLYSWQRGGVHYFYYTIFCDPTQMTAPRVEGFRITKVWDEDRRSAEMFSRVFYGRPEVCDRFDQVSDDVDLVFIADCNYDGSDHLELAQPGLEKGVTTFVDKPLANNLDDSLRIMALAAKHKANVLSLSILQTNPAVAQIVKRLEEVGQVQFGTVTCAFPEIPALIHAISTVHEIFGTGVQAVSCLKAKNHTAFHLSYGDLADRPEHGVMINCGVSKFRFTEMFVNVYGPEGAVQGLALSDFNASEGSAVILKRVRDMVRTGKPDPKHHEMLMAMAVADAAYQAESTGETTEVARLDSTIGTEESSGRDTD